MTTPQKWEYAVEEGVKTSELVAALNRLGAEGWEVVGVAGGGGGPGAPSKTLRQRRDEMIFVFLKRPLTEG